MNGVVAGIVGAQRRGEVERREAGRRIIGEGAIISAVKACGSIGGRLMLNPCSTGT